MMTFERRVPGHRRIVLVAALLAASQAPAHGLWAAAVPVVDGVITLEVALKASAYAAQGQDSLSLILAVGPEDSFSPRHSFRTALSVPLARAVP